MSSQTSFRGLASRARPASCPRNACGPCHKTKAKCIYESARGQCSRCKALQRACIPRRKKRMGRPPASELFPNGCSILELDRDAGEPVDASIGLRSLSHDYELSGLTDVSDDLIWGDLENGAVEPSIYWDSFELAEAVFISPNLYTPEPLVQPYPELGHMLATKKGFFDAHRQFMLGQCFVDDFQFAVRSVFARAPQTLSLAYSTCLHLLNHRQVQPKGLDGIDIKYGFQCLDLLMRASSRVRDAEDAAVVLMMGQIMLVYNMLLSDSSSRTITQGMLIAVKDWYPALMREPRLDPITLLPMFVDTVYCLVRRQRPVVRPPKVERLILDRILGLCWTLLPLISDLCELSYQAKMNTSDAPGYPGCDPYLEIEDQVRSWAPPLYSDLLTKCQSSEIAAILAQARSYRIATLLVIHRLRFPLGVEDAVGQEYAKSIVDELSFMTRWPTNGATGFGLDFPLLVAMMEMPGSGGDLFRAFGPLRFQPHLSNQMIDLVNFVRKEYSAGYNGLWFDLVEGSTMTIFIP